MPCPVEALALILRVLITQLSSLMPGVNTILGGVMFDVSVRAVTEVQKLELLVAVT